MRWSLPLGRIFGIPIKVHFTFFLLLAFVYYEFAKESASTFAGLLAVLLACILFTCVLEFLQEWNPPLLVMIRSFFLGRALIGTSFGWWDFSHYVLGCLIGWGWVRFLLSLEDM